MITDASVNQADPGRATIALLEFHGARPADSLAPLAARLPPEQVQLWDALGEPGQEPATLREHAENLIATRGSAVADRVIVVGSCFGAPLARACGALLAADRDRGVTTVSVDPADVTRDALVGEINMLAARVAAPPYLQGVDQPNWRAAAVDHLRRGAVRQALADTDDPDEAEDIGRLLADHYSRWLGYLDLCRAAPRTSPDVARTAAYIVASQGPPSAAADGGRLDLGAFTDTADVLASPALARWLTGQAGGSAA